MGNINQIIILRKRRLSRMTDVELDRLNGILVGKGIHWATKERREVCKEIARRNVELFASGLKVEINKKDKKVTLHLPKYS